MSKNLPDIEDLFRDSIEAHEEMPQEKVWDGIDRHLDEKDAAITEKKYKRLKIWSAAMALLLLGTLIYEWQTNFNQQLKGTNITVISNASKSQDSNSKQSMPIIKATVPGVIDRVDFNQAQNDNAVNTHTEKKSSQSIAQSGSAAGSLLQPVVPAKQNTTENAIKNISDYREQKTSAIVKNKIYSAAALGHKYNQSTAVASISAHSTTKNILPGKIALTNKSESIADDENETNVATAQPVISFSSIYGASVLQKGKTLQPAIIQSVAAFNSHITINAAPLWQPAQMTKQPAVVTARKKTGFHFSVMPYFAPQFYFNHIVDNDDHRVGGQRQADPDDIKKDENHQRSYSFGLLLDVPLKKRWFLQTGASYTSRSIEIEPKKIYARAENGSVQYRFDFSSGYTYLSAKNANTPVVGDSIIATESSSSLKYIGIPLTINYHFLKGKFNIIPSFGGMFNFLIKENMYTNVIAGSTKQAQDITNIQGLKKTSLSALAGVAFQYNASKRISVNITPSANFALGSINSNAAVKSYPNAFGVAAGIKIYF